MELKNGNPVSLVSEQNDISEAKQSMQRIEEMLLKLLAEKKSQEISRSSQERRSSPPPTPDPPDPMKARRISAPSPGLCAHRPQQIHQGGQIYPRSHVTRLSMEIPKFDGTRMRDWVALCEEFFYLNRTVPELMVREASLHLEGKALQWHHDYIRNRYGLYPSWPEYMIDMSARFGWDADVEYCNRWVGSCNSDETDWNVQMIEGLKEYGVVYTPMVIVDNQMVAKATSDWVAHQVLDEMSAQSESNEIMVNAHLNEVLELDVSQVNKDVKRDEMDEFSSVDELYSTVHKDSCEVVEISKQIEEIAHKQEVEEIDQVEIMSALIVSEMRSDLAAQQVISKMSVSVEISKVPEFNVLLNHGEEIKKDEMNEAPSVARKHLNTVASQPFDERSKLIEKGTELLAATSKDIVLADDTVSPNMEQAILSFDPGGAMKLVSNSLNPIKDYTQEEINRSLAGALLAKPIDGFTLQLVFNLGIIDEGGTTELNAVLHPVRLIEKKSHGHIGAATSFDPRGAIAAHRVGYRMNGIDEPRLQGSAIGYKTHRGKEKHILSLETSFVNPPAYFALNEPKFALGSLLHSTSVGELTPSAYFEKFAFDPGGGEVYAACYPRLSTSLPLNSIILDNRGLLKPCKEGVASFAFDPGGASMIFDDNNPFGYLSLFDSVIQPGNSQDAAECIELLTFDPGGRLLVIKAHLFLIVIADFTTPHLIANLKGVRHYITAQFSSFEEPPEAWVRNEPGFGMISRSPAQLVMIYEDHVQLPRPDKCSYLHFDMVIFDPGGGKLLACRPDIINSLLLILNSLFLFCAEWFTHHKEGHVYMLESIFRIPYFLPQLGKGSFEIYTLATTTATTSTLCFWVCCRQAFEFVWTRAAGATCIVFDPGGQSPMLMDEVHHICCWFSSFLVAVGFVWIWAIDVASFVFDPG